MGLVAGEHLVVLIAIFAVFIPALMLPGPDFIGVVRSSLGRGTKAGLLTTAGVTIGLGFYATLSLVGLAAIMIQYQWLAITVRVLGGLYLCYLGVRLLLEARKASNTNGYVAVDGQDNKTGAWGSLLFGFTVTLTNPKAIVLFASVFAPAITTETPVWLMVAMVSLVMLSSAVWYTCVSLFFTAPIVHQRFLNARHWIERIAGVCFVAIGGSILFDSKSPVTGS